MTDGFHARAISIRERLEQLSTIRRDRDLAFALKQRSQGLRDQLRALSSSLELFTRLSPEIPPADVESARERARVAAAELERATKFCDAPGTAARFATGPLDGALGKLGDLLAATALRAWFGFVATRPSPQQAELLQTLRKFSDFEAEAGQLMSIHRVLEGLAALARPTVAQIDAFTSQLSEWHKAWAPIEAKLPSEVSKFLTASAAEGAGIASLSTVVRKWLSEHGVEHLFRIRLS